ncbi:GNAT family N-acetyltransferase [Bacillus manliponensis]|uniref:GNAT family N-acetyltransferase n=1 Tax=Bacillus manliponensis TaxID=574376 RepID=UPI0035168DA8
MKPLLLDFPTLFQTERLQVRKPFPGDGAEVYEAVQASLQELQPWMKITHETEEAAEAIVREAHGKFLLRETLPFHLYDKATGAFIGALTLHPENWDIPKFSISFWLHSSHTKQGYMTEALKGAIQFAFDKLGARRLEIRCNAENENARLLAERLEFILEGTLENDYLTPEGSLNDTCVFAKIN